MKATLGQVFMRNFYIVFDQANMKIGFAPLAYSPKLKHALEPGSKPSCSYTTYYKGNCDASSAPASSTSTSSSTSSIT